jgi:outer membrane immunogenic protein
MKRLTIMASAGLLAVAMASPSFAADLPRPAYKAPASYIAPFSWTGFYVGVNAGYGWGKSDWTNTAFTTGNFKTDGFLGGGTLGYNLQTGVWVFGLEGDFDYTNIKGANNTVCGVGGCQTRNTWLSTGRGRIGYAWDRWLPYITGGVAFADVKMTTPTGADESKDRFGYTLGAGVEYAFLGAWSAKLEYLYVNMGNTTCDPATCGLATTVKDNINIVRAGINYRF